MTSADFNDFKYFLQQHAEWKTKADEAGNKNNVVEDWEFSKYVKENWGEGTWSGEESKSISNDIINKFWNEFDTNKEYGFIKDGNNKYTTAKNAGALDNDELTKLKNWIGEATQVQPDNVPTTTPPTASWRYTDFTITEGEYLDNTVSATLTLSSGTVVNASGYIMIGKLPNNMLAKSTTNGVEIAGQPSQGTYSFDVAVYYDNEKISTKTVTITVNPAKETKEPETPTVEWSNTEISAKQNEAIVDNTIVSATLKLNDEQVDDNIEYSVVEGNRLPNGMTATAGTNGVKITGTPTEAGEDFSITVSVKYNGKEVGTQTVKITVEEAAPVQPAAETEDPTVKKWNLSTFTETQNVKFSRRVYATLDGDYDKDKVSYQVGALGSIPFSSDVTITSDEDGLNIAGTITKAGTYSVEVGVLYNGNEIGTTTVTIKVEAPKQEEPAVTCPNYVYAGQTDETGKATLDGYHISFIDSTQDSVSINGNNGFKITAPSSGCDEIQFTITMVNDAGEPVKTKTYTVEVRTMTDISQCPALQHSSDDATDPVGGKNENGWYVLDSSTQDVNAKYEAQKNLKAYLQRLGAQVYQEAAQSNMNYNMSAIKYALTTTENYFTALIDAVYDMQGRPSNDSTKISCTYEDANGNLKQVNTSFSQTSRATINRTLQDTDVATSACGVFLMTESNTGIEGGNNLYKILIDKADIKDKFVEFYKSYTENNNDYTEEDDVNPIAAEEETNNEIKTRLEELKDYYSELSKHGGIIDNDTTGNEFMNTLQYIEGLGATIVVHEQDLDENDVANEGYNLEVAHHFSIGVITPAGWAEASGVSIGTLDIYSQSPNLSAYLRELDLKS